MRVTAERNGIAEGRLARFARPLRESLSRRLLVLTLLFVMLAEVLIFVPSIANFRLTWLEQRLAAAQIASLALEARPDNMVSPALREELLKNAQVYAVALHRDDARRLVLSEEMPPMVDTSFDLRGAMAMFLIMDAVETLFVGDGRVILVTGNPRFSAGESIEIVFDETPLRQAMLGYGKNIFLLSLVISIITASLVFTALHFVLVRPMRRITENMVAFRSDPEDTRRVIAPSGRADEIGIAERELSLMQKEIRATLSQKAHLAALGAAVSKISHDLRNILASAQLISDRIGAIDDPTVQNLAPRLFSAVGRAIDLCADTLKFGRAEEAPPRRRRFALAAVVDEVVEAAWPENERIGWHNDVAPDLEIEADPDQLFRILLNLTRNAAQALTESAAGGEIRIAAR
ncbi:MAG: histidine kinase, partial [Alphaproteobacteria bacterium HGW-Alphaproteobacteria-11]